MDLSVIRAEIEHMRRQIQRQRKEIHYLQRAGISTTSAEKLLGRMQSKVDGLCAERDRLMGEEQRRKYPGTDYARTITADVSGGETIRGVQ
jgi:hypothetical protein